MPKSLFWSAVLASSLMLSACDKRPSDPISPQTGIGTATAATPPPPVPDPSVPAASAVLGSAPDMPPAASGIKPSGPLSRTEESSAMPMVGQANDHSAPSAADRAASSR